MLRNNRGSAMVVVLTVAVILNIALIVVFISTTNGSKKAGLRKAKTSALNIAEAGKEYLYGQVRNGLFTLQPLTNAQVCNSYSFGGGTFSVSCSTNVSTDTIWARSTGQKMNSSTTIEVIAALSPDINIPYPPIKGAVTSRSSVKTDGNLDIDGRDYDTNMVLVGNGIYGVSTCGTLDVGGSSTIGGNGLAPVSKHDIAAVESTVCKQNASVDSTFDSPEKFLGLPPGSLDEFKTTTLNPPFQGLYYVTLDYVGPLHLDNSSGILIVHNITKSAELQINNGTFKGLIITDRLARITGDGTIIGAVVTLFDGTVLGMNGMGTSKIKFSKQVLDNLTKYCKNMRKRVKEISWKEL